MRMKSIYILLAVLAGLIVAIDVQSSETTATPKEVKKLAGEFVAIPAGCLVTNAKDHKTCLDAFSIGKYEVTQRQWLAVMGSNPSHFKSCGLDCPVESVSWDDVQLFIQALNSKTGKNFRLPTEAEWEYAGRSNLYPINRYIAYRCGTRLSRVGDAGWSENNSSATTHPVGQKLPNEWGVHDACGNVLEWVQDWYGENGWFSRSYPSRDKNPTGPNTGVKRVLRGGSWFDYNLTVTDRDANVPSVRMDFIGFRLAISP